MSLPSKIISLEDFISHIKNLVSIHYGDPARRDDYYTKDKTDKTPYIYVEWSTGGTRGGSCWGDSENYAYTSDDQPSDLTDLDLIIENIASEITFMEYKKITRNIIETDSRSVDEYYGNSTNYAMKKCNLEKLYTVLVENNIL